MKKYSFLIIILVSSCLSGKINQTEIEQVKFGSGGGFTGAVKTYTLTADGRLLDESKELKKINLNQTLEYFNKANELRNYTFNHPDNVYSFIEIKTKEKTNRIVWSFGNTQIDTQASALYNTLISITQ
ncbi:MAG: hypothetical protein JST69_03765 [Bacteroidetes bacterium]|nr:hypothetical protein [Bacteroidota bacterium]